jgi:phospholipid transport system substrate-binding protein
VIRWNSLTAGVIVLLLTCLWTQPLLAAKDPQVVVRETTNSILDKIKQHKQELENAPEKIYPMVEDLVLPQFSFTRMSQLVLGKYWKKATATQQKQFTQEFRELLVRTYAVALLNYSGQEIEYLPIKTQPGNTKVVVKTIVKGEDTPPLPIDYKLYLHNGEWRVYDLVIDNLSLLSNYRTNYGSKIRRYGIDGLLKRLQEHNDQNGK